jgi:aminoglycoside/choline kinase family phosphotransferase
LATTHPDRARQDTRRQTLEHWLASLDDALGLDRESLEPASNDASFRRYFRIRGAGGTTLIVMDAPPPQEDTRPFIHAAKVLKQSGVSVPAVLAADTAQGFLLLEDFGNATFLGRLKADAATAPLLYQDAWRALVTMQQSSAPGLFPAYSRELLLRELMLFQDWYLARHKEVRLDAQQSGVLQAAFERILANNLAQPSVFVHRDYHSRNLMVLPGERNPGILDFQDAVYGPITYDLVSLLRDAYIRWDEAQVLDWAIRYWEAARAAGLPVAADFSDFYRDFEWMGLQRHLKVLGIFARLFYRDGKPAYLDDMPLVLEYVLQVVRRYVDLAPLARLIEGIEERRPLTRYTV